METTCGAGSFLVGRALEGLENPSVLTLIRKQLESPREATSLLVPPRAPHPHTPRGPYILTETIRGEAVERSGSERRRSEGVGASGRSEASGCKRSFGKPNGSLSTSADATAGTPASASPWTYAYTPAS